MHTNIAQLIYRKVSPMPEALAQEIVDFVDFFTLKHQHHFQDTQLAQMSSLEKIGGNSADDV